MFKKNNSTKSELNEAIENYRSGLNCSEDCMQFIIEGFIDRINYQSFKLLGFYDDDITADIIYELTTSWIYKDGIDSYYDWINSSIYYYIKNECDRETFKGLTDWEIRKFQNMYKKKKCKEDYDKDEYFKIESKILNIDPIDDKTYYNVKKEEVNEADYIYKNSLNCLSQDEKDLLELYYIKKIKQKEIGEIYGVTKMAISKRLKKIKNKIKLGGV